VDLQGAAEAHQEVAVDHQEVVAEVVDKP